MIEKIRAIRLYVTFLFFVVIFSNAMFICNAEQGVAIISQPVDCTVEAGREISVKVEAVGVGLSYKWEYSDDDGKTWNISGIKGNTYNVQMNKWLDGRKLKVTVSDGTSSVTSNIATVRLKTALAIISQPVDCTVEEGKEIGVKVEATGTDISYKWEYSDDNGKTWKVSGIAGNTYNVSMNKWLDGRKLKVTVSDGTSSVTSNIVTVRLKTALAIISQPVDCTVEAGREISVKIEVADNIVN